MLVRAPTSPLRTRPRVRRAPGIPCALPFSRVNPIKTRAHRAARLRRYVLNEAQRVYEDLLGRKTTKFQRLLIALSSRPAIWVELSRCIARETVAGELGFEPRQTESESVVLPLHHSPPK